MLNHLRPFDAFVWLAIAAGQLILSFIIHRRRMEKTYPAFCLFVYFAAIKTIALMVTPLAFYLWLYYPLSIIANCLMAATIAGMYRRVMGPRISLPGWVHLRVGAWLAAAVSFSAAMIVVIVLAHPQQMGSAIMSLISIESALISGMCLASWLLIIYSRFLGISWRPWPERIMFGFAVLLTFNGTTMFLLGLTSPETAEVVRRIGMMSYVISLAWWGFALWGEEPATEKVTLAMLTEVWADYEETTREAAARL
jgi:hypothetical protein